MEFIDVFGDIIYLTEERWKHILEGHPEILPLKVNLREVLEASDFITRSLYDPEIFLYYKFYTNIWNGKYIVVVIKKNKRNFMLTAYITDRVKGGKIIWQKN